jgi:predicted  nucleic acid-binding Zn-ribbon protein
LRETVYALIELQEVDIRLDELMEERGDLPLIVHDLEAKLNDKKEVLKNVQKELKGSKISQREVELEVENAKAMLDKYEEQLYQVKTNKEYDAISLESEAAKQKEKEGDVELKALSEAIKEKENSIEQIKSELSALEEELASNKVELKSRMNATAKEEKLLKKKRDVIIAKTSPDILKNYEMVRSARDGYGVAKIENSVCGGCFSYIPPQKIVEIKKMKKVYSCEFCGRILVWDEAQA